MQLSGICLRKHVSGLDSSSVLTSRLVNLLAGSSSDVTGTKYIRTANLPCQNSTCWERSSTLLVLAAVNHTGKWSLPKKPLSEQGRIWGWVPGYKTPPPYPKVSPSVFVCLFFYLQFFSFSCVSSILDYNNEQGKPRWIFKVNYCGELFFEVFCFCGK